MAVVNTVIKTKGFQKEDKLWFVDLDNKSTDFKVPEFGGYHVKFGTVLGYSSYIGERSSFRDYFIGNGIFTKRLPYWNTFRQQENAEKLAAYATKLLTRDYVGRKWRELPPNVVNKIKSYALGLESLESEECVHTEISVKYGYRVTELIVYDDNSYKIKSSVRAIDFPAVEDFIELEPLPGERIKSAESIEEKPVEYSRKEPLVVDSLDKGNYRVIKVKGLPGELIEFNYGQTKVSGVIAYIETGKDNKNTYCVTNGSETIRLTDKEIISNAVKEWCIATEWQPGDLLDGCVVRLLELHRSKVRYIF